MTVVLINGFYWPKGQDECGLAFRSGYNPVSSGIEA